MRARLKKHILKSLAVAAAILLPGAAQAQTQCMPQSDVFCLDQGATWNNTTRASFYSVDQGSQLMPYSWFQALTTPDGQPFRQTLVNYGYLPDTFRKNGLPVGFTVSTWTTNPMLGMTCAACHTRDIERNGQVFRVDGGPAIVDFRALLSDLIDAVGRVKDDETSFKNFAKSVLGLWHSDARRAKLKAEVELWYLRENTLRERAYPDADIWGLGRLDAVAMIFNRLTGMDLGPAPDYLIPENIRKASAPVRYPFLWNAAIQDKTQWPGFSSNGSSVAGLARNTGEVIGVFGKFHPVEEPGLFSNMSFSKINSASTWGLLSAENLVRKIGSPKWPAQFPIIQGRVAQGAKVYQQECASCHFLNPVPAGQPGFPGGARTWLTPIHFDVETDSHEYDILNWKADPGVLAKLRIHFLPKFRIPTDPQPRSFDLLKYSVIGSALDTGAVFWAAGEDIFGKGKKQKSKHSKQSAFDMLDKNFGSLDQTHVPDPKENKCAEGKFCYESRVMFGIWAAAPYLHNGSVPTMWDLLHPADKRPSTFAVGPAYDPIKMGMSAKQPGNYTRTTTGCNTIENPTARNSGNSNCGHNFGTGLSDADKWALIEYMKTI